METNGKSFLEGAVGMVLLVSFIVAIDWVTKQNWEKGPVPIVETVVCQSPGCLKGQIRP